MSEGTLHIELSSPNHAPIQLDAAKAVLPGGGGVMTVYPGHTPLLTTIIHGAVIAYDESETMTFFAVHGGFTEILDNKILVLADGMEPADSIDDKRAEAAIKRATERLEKPESDLDVQRAQASLARANARMQAHRGEEY